MSQSVWGSRGIQKCNVRFCPILDKTDRVTRVEDREVDGGKQGNQDFCCRGEGHRLEKGRSCHHEGKRQGDKIQNLRVSKGRVHVSSGQLRKYARGERSTMIRNREK